MVIFGCYINNDIKTEKKEDLRSSAKDYGAARYGAEDYGAEGCGTEGYGAEGSRQMAAALKVTVMKAAVDIEGDPSSLEG